MRELPPMAATNKCLAQSNKLLGIEQLGTAAKAVPLQLPNDCRQPLELLGMMRPLGQEAAHAVHRDRWGRNYQGSSQREQNTSSCARPHKRLASELLCRVV